MHCLYTVFFFIMRLQLVLMFCHSVPAAVRALTLAQSGTTDLRVTWAAAAGDVDHYEVQILCNDTSVFSAEKLSNTARQHHFFPLSPGHLYKIVVSTISGSYVRPQFIEGRTGKNDTSKFIRICSYILTSRIGNAYLTPGLNMNYQIGTAVFKITYPVG